MSRTLRWIVAGTLVLGLATAGCGNLTGPFPDQDEEEQKDSGDDSEGPGQAMILTYPEAAVTV